MVKDHRFTVVEGGGTPRPEGGDEVEQWVCRTCEAEIGVASSEVIKLTIAPRIKAGKLIDGTEVYVCAQCHLRGTLTRVGTGAPRGQERQH